MVQLLSPALRDRLLTYWKEKKEKLKGKEITWIKEPSIVVHGGRSAINQLWQICGRWKPFPPVSLPAIRASFPPPGTEWPGSGCLWWPATPFKPMRKKSEPWDCNQRGSLWVTHDILEEDQEAITPTYFTKLILTTACTCRYIPWCSYVLKISLNNNCIFETNIVMHTALVTSLGPKVKCHWWRTGFFRRDEK